MPLSLPFIPPLDSAAAEAARAQESLVVAAPGAIPPRAEDLRRELTIIGLQAVVVAAR